jgi:hypothetical protein
MNDDKHLGNFFVIPGDGYGSDDERDNGSSEQPPQVFLAFFCTEAIGASIINTNAIARLEFRHDAGELDWDELEREGI